VRKLKRSINMGFRVTEEEQALIRERMSRLGVRSLRAYLLRMAVCGYVINIDMSDVWECSRLLRIVSNNVNQIARRANERGSIYGDDLADIKARLDDIWMRQNVIIRDLSKVLEAA
jgi:hypothetical protein